MSQATTTSGGLYTAESRLVRLETSVFGIDGRGGIFDEIEELKLKIDRVNRNLIAAAISFASLTVAVIGGILTHAL